MLDVVVAGGGPVGLATALYLRQVGLSVTVVEPRTGAIDKACGEGLLPPALAALTELGVDPAGSVLRGIRYTDGRRTAEAAFPAGPGRGVRRTALHTALVSAVRAEAIPIVAGSVAAVVQGPDSVTAAGLTARYLVAADGLHSPIRKQLGLLSDRSAGAPRWGQRRHFTCAPWTDLVEVHWASGAEAYVTPVSEDLVGVAVLSSRRASYDTLLAEFPSLQERLRGQDGSPVRGAGPLRQHVTARRAGRVLLVGDAAGYVDALTGEGISVGLRSARSLAECLAADAPQDWERAWRRSSRRYRVLTEGLLRSAQQPAVRRAIVPAAATAPRLFAAIVGQLAH